MKKFLVCILLFSMFISLLSSCNNTAPSLSDDNQSTNDTLKPSFDFQFPSPFPNVEEGDSQLTDEEIGAIISQIPSDEYEVYPGLHNVPLTATLYKNNEVVSIDVRDSRLIGMINLYNNAVYHNQYAYSQGSFNPADLEKLENESFRLVLKYIPQNGNMESSFDTIIVTNKWFVGIRHDIPFGDYPHSAFSRHPLYDDYRWLDLFGF